MRSARLFEARANTSSRSVRSAAPPVWRRDTQPSNRALTKGGARQETPRYTSSCACSLFPRGSTRSLPQLVKEQHALNCAPIADKSANKGNDALTLLEIQRHGARAEACFEDTPRVLGVALDG